MKVDDQCPLGVQDISDEILEYQKMDKPVYLMAFLCSQNEDIITGLVKLQLFRLVWDAPFN